LPCHVEPNSSIFSKPVWFNQMISGYSRVTQLLLLAISSPSRSLVSQRSQSNRL
jgi:hypothetical protein